MDSEMGQTPNQHVKPARKVCSRAPWRAKYGGRRGDLIGKLEGGLEVLVGWESQAHAHARMAFSGGR